MGDSGEGLIDADARIQERMEELERERTRQQHGKPVRDPVKMEALESLRLARTELDRHYPGGGRDAVVQSYGDPSQRMMMIRVPHVGAEAGTSLEKMARSSAPVFFRPHAVAAISTV